MYTAIGTANGREGRGVSSDGRLDVKLTQPKELGGNGEGTNPEQLFAVGWASCFTSAMQLVAHRQQVDVGDASVTAEIELRNNGKDGFGLAATLRVELPDHLSPEQGRTLVEAAHQLCPYSNATRGNIPVALVIE